MSQQFFTTIQKINSLLFFVLACLVIIGLLWGSYLYLNLFHSNTDQGLNDALLTEQAAEHSDLFLGAFNPIAASNTYFVALSSFADHHLQYDDTNVLTHNYLFINDEQMHWLLPHNEATILHHRSLYEYGLLFQIVDNDTNQDGNLDDNDLSKLIAVNTTGHQMQTVLSDLNTFVDLYVSDNRLSILFEKNQRVHLQHFQLPDFQTSNAISVPTLYP